MTVPSSAPPGFRLLVACSRAHLELGNAATLDELLGLPLDWDEVLAEARRHGVTPLVHRHLSGQAEVPAAPLAELSTYARRNAVHNLLLSKELLRALGELEGAAVRAVPYKGPTLAVAAYGDVALRSFQDLDLIVRPNEFEPALDALQTSGYALVESAEGRFHATLKHEETGVLLELHHDVVRRNLFPTGLELAALWDRLESVDLLGVKVLSFAPEDTLLLLCLHGAKHEWQGLTWLCDLAEYLRTHPDLDWETVLRQAERARVTRVLLLGLALAAEVLAAPLPEAVRALLKRDRRLPGLVAEVVTRLHKDRGLLVRGAAPYRLRAGMRSRFADKLPVYKSFATRLFRPNEQDKSFVKLPKKLTGFYYLVRPLRLARDALAQTARAGAKRR